MTVFLFRLEGVSESKLQKKYEKYAKFKQIVFSFFYTWLDRDRRAE
jgi:hypothetical protein